MRTLWAGFFALALLISGCSGTQVQTFSKPVTPGPLFSGIKRVAVLPFDTLAEGAVGPKQAENILVQELLSEGVFDVVEEPRYVAGLMKKLKLRNTESLDREIVRKIGEELQVDAVIVGGLTLYGEEEKSTNIEFSFFLDMLHVETGDLIWSARIFSRSNTTIAEVFGLNEGPSVNELADDAMVELADELSDTIRDNRELELELIFQQQQDEAELLSGGESDEQLFGDEEPEDVEDTGPDEILLKVKPK
ncbi:MAG: hypothetical protein C0608_12115 [Deltaproteobacteria bacterium]|nr:MAG: hypothetical protein C0608_12115 [Deltaproteobacteria bacterium]